MTNPIDANRELARLLVGRLDCLVEQFYDALNDVVGKPDDIETIDSCEVQSTINTINGLRNLRVALVAGNTRTLFLHHRSALQQLLEMTLDMES